MPAASRTRGRAPRRLDSASTCWTTSISCGRIASARGWPAGAGCVGVLGPRHAQRGLADIMPGGSGGGVQELEWDGTVVWDFTYSNVPGHLQHHDVEMLPNGNVLMIAWEGISAAGATAAGRNPALIQGPTFYPDHIIEVQKTGPTSGAIVWSWHVMDHVIQDFDPTRPDFGVVADHPELLDLNYPLQPASDWNHVNSIDYHAEFDQILLSSHNQNEVWIIDHSTTTVEAAGHTGGNSGKGGDLLYRWG
ncbi:MAG TPA: hypothetical protein EYQ83_16980, partial [Acidobacteria bacterium]|nr:hypothetical protein [Acidobacteriota bacterium]